MWPSGKTLESISSQLNQIVEKADFHNMWLMAYLRRLNTSLRGMSAK